MGSRAKFETIAPYTIEEAYEVRMRSPAATVADLCEELGDLLLQTSITRSSPRRKAASPSTMSSRRSCRKMVRRHPHVFGDEAARSAKLAKGFWEDEAKDANRGTNGGSLLTSVPVALPGLDPRREAAGQGGQGRLRLAVDRRCP